MRVATQEDDAIDYEDVSFIVASNYRLETLRVLNESAATPSHIDDQTGIEFSHISRSLGELRERGLVTLLVPEHTKKGRIYDITDAGRRVLQTATDVNGGGG